MTICLRKIHYLNILKASYKIIEHKINLLVIFSFLISIFFLEIGNGDFIEDLEDFLEDESLEDDGKTSSC